MAATKRKPRDEMLTTLRTYSSAHANLWNVSTIRSAIDSHDRGDFSRSAALQNGLMRDCRVFAAQSQRVDTALGLPLEITPAEGGDVVAEAAHVLFAEGSTCLPPQTQAWLLRTARCFLGVAVAQIVWEPGETWTPRVVPWPMEHVRWNEVDGTYEVMTRDAGRLPIKGGDGKWLIYEPGGHQSWMTGPIRALGMAWADRTYAIRDRSRRSEMVGLSTFIGKLPDGVRSNTLDAAGFQTLLQSLQTGRGGLVIPPSYSVEKLEVDANGYEIFDSMIGGSNEDIQLALLGQTGSSTTKTGLGQGTNDTHDGVRMDLTEADVSTLYAGCIVPQVVRPWVELNWGRPEWTPQLTRCVPDDEEESRLASRAARYTAFVASVLGLRSIGIEPDLAMLAQDHGVKLP